MNNKERIVLWMGLILIGLNLVSNWAQIRSIIFAGAGTQAPGGSTANPSSPGFQIPGLPKLPSWIPTWPGTDIPLISQVTPNAAAPKTTAKTTTV
jgi:hypothetical protein